MAADSTSPSFSVVMAVHNGRAWLREALDSALSQEPPPREVIVVNDGSTDDTARILEEYAGRIKVIAQEKSGVSAARNRGIEAAAGDWIAFLDADDLWRPGHLAGLHNTINSHPDAGLVYADAMVIDEAGNQLKPHPTQDPGPNAVASLLIANFITTSAAAARKELILQAGGFRPELHYGEDWDLWLGIARLAPLIRVPGFTVHYRRNPGGAVANSGLDMRYEAMSVLDRIEAQWPDIEPGIMRRARARRFEESAIRFLVGLDTDLGRAEVWRSLQLHPWRLKTWLVLAASLSGPIILSMHLTRRGRE